MSRLARANRKARLFRYVRWGTVLEVAGIARSFARRTRAVPAALCASTRSQGQSLPRDKRSPCTTKPGSCFRLLPVGLWLSRVRTWVQYKLRFPEAGTVMIGEKHPPIDPVGFGLVVCRFDDLPNLTEKGTGDSTNDPIAYLIRQSNG